jgi:hypothetical protein
MRKRNQDGAHHLCFRLSGAHDVPCASACNRRSRTGRGRLRFRIATRAIVCVRFDVRAHPSAQRPAVPLCAGSWDAMGPPFARRRRPPCTLRQLRKGRDAGVVADEWSAPAPVGQAPSEPRPGEPDDRRLGPDSNRETTTGIVSGLSLTPIETPMNTGRPVSVETDAGARVPKQSAVNTIRVLVNRLLAGDLDGETRTRTGDTTIFSRAALPLSQRYVQGFSSASGRRAASRFPRILGTFAV